LLQQLEVSLAIHARCPHVVPDDEHWHFPVLWNDNGACTIRLAQHDVIAFLTDYGEAILLEDAYQLTPMNRHYTRH
jgi:hypothetical protein